MRYLVELTVIDPVTVLPKKLFWTSGDRMFPFLPDDPDRPNQFYDAVIKDVNGISAHMFSPQKISGNSTFSSGVIEVNNTEGALDYLYTYGFTLQKIEVYFGEGIQFSNYTKYISGVMDMPIFRFSITEMGDFTIPVRSSKKIFDKPLQTEYYLGTNSGATGVEGNSDSTIKNTLKPIALGEFQNISPVMVNSSAHKYQYSTGVSEGVTYVYGNGSSIPLTVTNPPPAGYAYDDKTLSIITLGTAPTGSETITCTGKGKKFGSTYHNTVGALIKNALLTYLNFTNDMLDLPAFTQMETDAPYQVQIYVSNEKAPESVNDKTTSIANIFDSLVNSVGGYWMFTQAGKFTLGVLRAPEERTDDPVYTFAYEIDIIDLTLLQSSEDDKGIPLSKLRLFGARNYTVLTAIAGAVDEDRKQWLEKDYREVVKTFDDNNTIYNADPFELQVKTQLVSMADCETEAIRQMNIRKIPRQLFSLICAMEILPGELFINSLITVIAPRLGLSSGKQFIVTGITYNEPSIHLASLEIWG
jgi:hypothetical protein